MAYERTNWQNGDVISSEKLNKMEAGIEYACSLEHEVEDPTDGQILKYDAEKGKFVNEDVPAAIETNIQNPTDGQTLKYDAESGKWVNGEGGGSSTLVVNVNDGTFDKTWQEIDDAFPNVKITDQTNRISLPVDIGSSNGHYYLDVLQINSQGALEPIVYAASSSDGYPKGHK